MTIPSLRTEVGTLSGGQRQQVAVARSLLGEPRVVLLDEPTAALGVPQTKQVLELIGRLRERGLGVVVISHNLVNVFEVADRIVVLRLGRAAGDFDAEATTEEHVVSAITGIGEARAKRGTSGGDLGAMSDAPRRRRGAELAGSPRDLRRLVQGDLASVRVVLGLALIWIIFQSQNDRFLTAQNLTNLMLQITAIGLISVGIVYVLLLGEIDLSVGAVSGLAAAVMAVLNVNHGWSPYLAIAAAILVGTGDRAAPGLPLQPLRHPLLRRHPGRPARLAGRALTGARLDRDDQPHRPEDHRPRQHLLLRHGRLDLLRDRDRRLCRVVFVGHRRRVAAGLDRRERCRRSASGSAWSRRSRSSPSRSSTPTAACRWRC